MMIRSMTATFGCLDNQTITFRPGLNVIHAPNEWGKSTWCAFLLAMFYGIDTRQRDKSGILADKSRYLPWSGKPMSGSVDLLWQGRAITIERHTQGRIPMGVFRAYETDSGETVPELNGENCGVMLLGVERSVFVRSGFISAENMALTPDEELSKRLNRLVTTGDDSPHMAGLEGKLRELRNKCRHHQSGALPRTQQELEQCQAELERQRELERQLLTLRRELERQRQWHEQLRHHDQTLRALADREKLAQVDEARRAEAEAERVLKEAARMCQGLPSMAQTAMGINAWKALDRSRRALELEWEMSAPIRLPEPPECFMGLNPEQAVLRAKSHKLRLEELREASRKPGGLWCFLAGGGLLLVGIAGGFLLPSVAWWIALPVLSGLGLCFLGGIREKTRSWSRRALMQWQERLEESYGAEDPETLAAEYQRLTNQAQARQQQRLAYFAQRREELELRARELDGDSLQANMDAWNAWAEAQRAYVRAKGHCQALKSMLSGQERDEAEGQTELTLSAEQTRQELEKAQASSAGLRSRMDACLGQLRALPPVEELELRIETLRQRIGTLEQWYQATTWAMDALERARGELRRRFAPQISREAGKILAELTGNRYDKLLLEENFSLLTKGEGESIARQNLWRSLGTQEQILLAVRLAISRVMLPDVPIILDDALSHFDDERMAAALTCLQTGQEQVIVFSCHSREKCWLEER